MSKERRKELKQESMAIFIASLLIGTGFLIAAIYMFSTNTVAIGQNLKTQLPTVSTAATELLLAVVFYAIAVLLYRKRNKPTAEG